MKLGREPASWEELYAHFNGVESRRSEVQRLVEEEAEALRQFEAWSSHAIDQLMLDLRNQAVLRAREFFENTGHALEVEYPTGAPIVATESGPEIRFLRLALGDALVHVYTSHTRGGLTHVHLLPSRKTSLKENDRLISEPGAFIVRRPDDAYELRHQRGDPDAEESTPMSLDTLLFRAFRLLVRWSEEPPASQRMWAMPRMPSSEE